MNSPTHIADLQMVADQLQADVNKLRDELAELAAVEEPTAEQAAQRERTAGAWLALRGVLGEALHPMLEGWSKGEPQSQIAEMTLAHEQGVHHDPEACVHCRSLHRPTAPNDATVPGLFLGRPKRFDDR